MTTRAVRTPEERFEDPGDEVAAAADAPFPLPAAAPWPASASGPDPP